MPAQRSTLSEPKTVTLARAQTRFFFDRYGDWLRDWRDFRAEPEQFFLVDHERVLVLVRNAGRGRASGYELEQRSTANLFELRDGKVVRFVLYWDRDRALADFDLEE